MGYWSGIAIRYCGRVADNQRVLDDFKLGMAQCGTDIAYGVALCAVLTWRMVLPALGPPLPRPYGSSPYALAMRCPRTAGPSPSSNPDGTPSAGSTLPMVLHSSSAMSGTDTSYQPTHLLRAVRQLAGPDAEFEGGVVKGFSGYVCPSHSAYGPTLVSGTGPVRQYFLRPRALRRVLSGTETRGTEFEPGSRSWFGCCRTRRSGLASSTWAVTCRPLEPQPTLQPPPATTAMPQSLLQPRCEGVGAGVWSCGVGCLGREFGFRGYGV
eukprot:1804634-Rhodomonas_salina.1